MADIPPRIKALIDATIRTEGGFVDDPDDPGGATNLGISLRQAVKYPQILDLDGDGQVTVNDIRLITPAIAEQFYYSLYMLAPHLEHLPERIQAQVFDTGVLSGDARAVIILQDVLNEAVMTAPRLGYATLEPDGQCGPATWNAAAIAEKAMGPYLSNALAEEREKYLWSLERTHPQFHKYLVRNDGGPGGWVVRCRSFREPVQ